MSDTTLKTLRSTLDFIEGEWSDLIRTNCNPLDIATPLLADEHNQEWMDFQKSKKRLQNDIRAAVNAHYMAFNDSVGAYGLAEESLTQSQDTLGVIKSQLKQVGDLIGKNNDLMVDLNDKRRNYALILEVLEQVQLVKQLVAQLEEAANDRNFELSVKLIKEIRDLSTNWGISKLPSLDNLFSRFQFCSDSLLEAAVDDINTLIYSNNNGSYKGLEGFLQSIEGERISDIYIQEIENLKFKDLQKKMEIVNKFGRQAEVLKILVSRTERETNKLVKKSIDEVKAKYPSQIELNSSTTQGLSSWGLTRGLNNVIVHELFEKIFKRFGLSMQKHILVYEFAKLNGNVYNIEKIWNVYQKRLGLAICHYIINEDMFQEAAEMNHNTKTYSPFAKVPNGLDTSDNEELLHFSSLNLNKSTKELNLIINSLLKTSENTELAHASDRGVFIGLDDTSNSKRLEVLVTANIFNMGEIMDSFILFCTNIEDNYPIHNGANIKSFFDQFMHVIYFHQLESVLTYEFERCCTPENPQSIQLFFQKVLSVLNTSLHFKEKYVQIVLNLLHLLEDKYIQLKNDLLSSTMPELLKIWYKDVNLKSISKESVDKMLTALYLPPENISSDLGMMKRFELTQQKGLEESIKFQAGMSKLSPSSFMSLEVLNSLVKAIGSLSAVLEWLPKMKRYVPELSNEISKASQLKETWMLNNQQIFYSSDRVFLALNNEYEDRFDSLVKNLEALKIDLELILRYEVRFEGLYCIKKLVAECDMVGVPIVRGGDLNVSGSNSVYAIIEEEVSDSVDDFCDRVSFISRIFDDYNVGGDGKIWIFGGLGFWLDRLVVRESRMIRKMIKGGWVKVMVNLRVLQQLIRKVDFGAELLLAWQQNVLGRALKYFSLGAEGDQLVNKIGQLEVKDFNFTKEEYTALVRLVYHDRSEEKRKLILNRIIS